jgi:hypothetical protein
LPLAKNSVTVKPANDVPPAFLLGSFVDDYKIKYTINDTLWVQGSRVKVPHHQVEQRQAIFNCPE